MSEAPIVTAAEYELLTRAEVAEREVKRLSKQLVKADEACQRLCGNHGFATGHGDTVADIIGEIDAQIRQWQPIETGPRDGTRVWLFYPDAHKDDRQVVGWFDRDQVDGDRWMDHADCREFIEPSHWRPLPPPPTDLTDEIREGK